MIHRLATSDDMGFILESFTKSVRNACTHVEGIASARLGQLLRNLLDKGWPAEVIEIEGLIAGWAVHSPIVLDGDGKPLGTKLGWIFVRDIFRGQGVARFLLNRSGVDLTRTVETPFMPNRGARRLRFAHRPFECLP